MEKAIKIQHHAKSTIETFVRNYKKDGKDRRTKPYYEARLKMLSNYWEAFKRRDEEIALLVTDDIIKTEAYFTGEIYSAVETFFIESYALIISDFERDFQPSSNKTSVDKESKVQFVNLQRTHDEVKLPKISLPTFAGDYLEWVTFYDLFNSLVHENTHISPVQKLQYLKAHLAGEAKSLLSNTTITSANYDSAWNMLVARYNNRRVLVKTQLDVLFNQTVVNQESAKGVKNLLDKTSECLAALKNLEVNTETWDPILVYLIGQRLPYETLSLWEQSLSTKRDPPQWEELKEFLEARFRTLEAISLKRKPVIRDNKSIVNAEKSWRKPQTFHVTTKASCSLCYGSHPIRQCSKYLELNSQARFEAIKSKGLCVNCLGTGHLLSKCPSKIKCMVCQKSHHTTLHKNSSENEKDRSIVYPESSEKAFVVTSPVEILEEAKSFHINHPSNSTQVLLATALVAVISASGRKQICKALIDPGSQASFVTERVVQALGLDKESLDINVSGLGNTLSGRIKARVKFTIMRKDTTGDVIQVRALVLKNITSIVPGQRVLNTNWGHLQGLELADPSFSQPGRVDLLLGADVYPLILLDGVRRGANGTPLGQHTIFGWILSGVTSIHSPKKLSC